MSLLLDALKQAEGKGKTPTATVSGKPSQAALRDQPDMPFTADDRVTSEAQLQVLETSEADIEPAAALALETEAEATAVAPPAKATPDTSALDPADKLFAATGDRKSKRSVGPRLIALLLALALLVCGLLAAYFWLDTHQRTPVYPEEANFEEEIPGDELASSLPDEPETDRSAMPQIKLLSSSRPVETVEPVPAATATAESSANVAKPQTNNEKLQITGKQPIEIRKRTLTGQQSQRLSSGYQALLAGDYRQARQEYQNVLAENPKQIDALLALAKIYSDENDILAAQRFYERILDIDASNALAQLGLLHTFRRQGAGERLKLLQQLVEKYPQSSQIVASLGHELAQQSKWRLAQQAYFKAFSLNPDNPQYAYNLAVSLDRMEKYDAARRLYQQALKLHKSSGVALDIETVKQRLSQLGGDHD